MRTLRLVVTAAAAALAALAVVIAVSLAGLRIAGYHPEVVYSGSMEPTYPVGSVVFVRAIAGDAARVGDVVTFADPQTAGRLITHRVVQRIKRPDGYAYRTRGDANGAADPWTIELPGRVGKVEFDIPVAGYVLWYARTREVRLVCIGLIGALLAAAALRAIWRPDPRLAS